MNRHTSSSDSPRWWPSGLAGAAATLAVTSLFVLALAPASPAKEREPERYDGGSVTQPVTRGAQVPCFIVPIRWDVSLDGPIPTCASRYLAAR